MWIRQSHDGPRLLVMSFTIHPIQRCALCATKGNLTPHYLDPSVSCHSWINSLQKIETSFVSVITLTCFTLVSSRDVYEHSFHELTMRYSISDKIHISRALLSFLWAVEQRSWRKSINLFMMTWINLLKKEDHCELVKIVEDLCKPLPSFLT
jgi:hypothetical protein